MAWSFNPFTGNLDIVGGGAVVFEGEVETFADLSETIGDPAVGASFLVRSSTGVWLVNRRQAGIWIRKNNTGVRATDWEYGGDYPVNSVNGQTGNVSLGSSDVAAEPIDYTVVTSATTLANGAKVAADTTAGAFTLTLPATPSNGDTITVLDYAGTFDTNNLTIARNGSNIESLAEDLTCNVEDAAFTLVFVGSTVGWKVVPYFGNKTNFASPDPIGSSVPNTGAFTTLTANNGTITASAPVLDLAQTWNASGTTFTGARIDITNTASATGSRFLDCVIGGNSAIRLARIGSSSYALFSTADTGIGAISTSQAAIMANGGVAFVVNSGSGGAYIRSDSPYAWASGTNLVGATTDLFLRRDAANTLAQYNGTAAQTFRIYNTFTSATNFERLNIIAQAAGSVIIGTEKGSGGGTARALEFQTDGIGRLTITSTGLFQFGGASSGFPALKRAGSVLQVRFADDLAYTTLEALHRLFGAAPATTGATGTPGDLRYDADYIYVCTAANTWKRAAIATW